MEFLKCWQTCQPSPINLVLNRLAISRLSASVAIPLAYLDVFVDEGTTGCYVYLRGRWERTEGLAGLERFDPIKTKKLLDTSTGEMVDTGVLVGS
jgi:hypothetical protein